MVKGNFLSLEISSLGLPVGLLLLKGVMCISQFFRDTFLIFFSSDKLTYITIVVIQVFLKACLKFISFDKYICN